MAKKKVEPPKRMDYVLIQLKDNRAQLIRMSENEPHNLAIGEVVLEGNVEAVKAAAQLLAPGNWKLEKCITPNFQIGYHHMYEEIREGDAVCWFCKEL